MGAPRRNYRRQLAQKSPPPPPIGEIDLHKEKKVAKGTYIKKGAPIKKTRCTRGVRIFFLTKRVCRQALSIHSYT